MLGAETDVPILSIDREPNVAVFPGGRFDVLDEDLAFVRSMRRDDEPAAAEGNVCDAFQNGPFRREGARESYGSSAPE
jgi:hypothetical protein